MRWLALVGLLGQGDPFEDTETRPDVHRKLAELADASSDEDSQRLALFHRERAIDNCGFSMKDPERVEARRKLHACHDNVPPNLDEKKANPWKVLAVVFRQVAFRFGRQDPRTANYRTPDEVVKNIRAGLDAFAKFAFEASRGAIRVDVRLVLCDDPVRSLRQEDEGYWMNTEDFEANAPKIRFKDGEFESLFLYLYDNSRDPKNSVPLAGPSHWGGIHHFARGWNFMPTADDAAKNAATGTLEIRHWLRSVRGVLSRVCGYPERLVPDATEDKPKDDACFVPAKEDKAPILSWCRHLCEDHITSRMWRELDMAPPAAPFISRWLVSERFRDEKHEGFDREFIDEKNRDPDLRTWPLYKRNTDYVSFNFHFTGSTDQELEKCAAYAATYVYVKKRTWARALYGASDGIKIIVNGEIVHAEHDHGDPEPDSRAARFVLQEGRNLVLVKMDQQDGPWGFSMRLSDLLGAPLKAEISPARH